MRELKRVEGQSFDIRAAAQQEEYSMGQQQASGESSDQTPTTEAIAPESAEDVDEKRKASVGGKKKGITAGKATGPVAKPVKPEQKKLADKVGDVKRAGSVKVKTAKTAAADPAEAKSSAGKVKQTLKKAMSVTTARPKTEVGRTKSLGVKEKKVAPPTAPKPSKATNDKNDANAVETKSAAETKAPLGDQSPGNPSGSTASKTTAVSKQAASKAANATAKPTAQVTKEKKSPAQVAGSVGAKKEVSEKKDTAGKKRPSAEKAKEAVAPRSKPTVAKTTSTSNPTEARTSGSIRKKVSPAVVVGAGEKSGKGPNSGCPAPDSDIMSQSMGPTGVQAAKRTPPVVPPKPSSPNKSRISPTGAQSDSSIPSSPVVGHKSSIAERARLVGALEVTSRLICQCHLCPDHRCPRNGRPQLTLCRLHGQPFPRCPVGRCSTLPPLPRRRRRWRWRRRRRCRSLASLRPRSRPPLLSNSSRRGRSARSSRTKKCLQVSE